MPPVKESGKERSMILSAGFGVGILNYSPSSIKIFVMRGKRQTIELMENVYFRARGLLAKLLDCYYRIQTESSEPFRLAGLCKDGVRYQPTPYWLIRKIIKRIDLCEDDVVFDLGCGKGRVVAVFSRQKVHQVIGIEIDEGLAQVAARNANRVRGRRSPIRILCENAADANYEKGTVFFLFNPFGIETLEIVLSRIESSVVADPRSVRIVYYNPRHVELFRSTPWLDFTIWEKKLWLRKSKFVLIAKSRQIAKRIEVPPLGVS